ncbi:hypothetical protein ABB37_08037 [Leptomonas pyrrhocoris]|uniref:Uncharacterized protein n=1 Tax=Leptomonas pyrrhocoris TaxID=157538 RepID=A0A0N0DSR7_LEPPY|nr:hypothetical protein ABB37_08037 [Leptomonas pyrrhocoris]KPA76322.1 hypothetical protein ABB37_08037 [Leptomonas pyrrhocoris]|eukprot:XP_015654761.1 hypothetical protein ABB37_08037 [Leptomonas pyrrhocoris]
MSHVCTTLVVSGCTFAMFSNCNARNNTSAILSGMHRHVLEITCDCSSYFFSCLSFNPHDHFSYVS